jgi:hypothetical protein
MSWVFGSRLFNLLANLDGFGTNLSDLGTGWVLSESNVPARRDARRVLYAQKFRV